MDKLYFKIGFIGLMLIFNCCQTMPQSNSVSEEPYSILCIGDSYTIGESVKEEKKFPSQLHEILLKKSKFKYRQPVVVAKTGWTTDEMIKGLKRANLDRQFDFVTLCIGVNDQYRGRPAQDFIASFKKCLNTAIGYVGGNKSHVIVLSIPDWGVTPYAKENNFDPKKVALEIDAYNQIKDSICTSEEVPFINITNHYRKKGALPEGCAPDGLHPSAMIYEYWAKNLSKHILKN